MSKLIFLDIDGTLTEAGTNTPPDSAVRAMEQARKKGHKLFLCTGRNPDMLSPLLRYPFDGMVASSGGYVKVGDKVLYDHPIPAETLKLALDTLHRNGVFCTIEGTEGSFGDADLKDFLDSTEGGNSEIERWRKALSASLGIRPMSEYAGEEIHKIVIMAREAAQLSECKQLLEKDFHFVIQDVPAHGCVNGEIVSHDFDKGKGVRRIVDYFGADIADTIGFGDSMNDLEMMETVGYSVCMENGSPALKERADWVGPAGTEDGIYIAFEKLGLL